ncbi:aldo/keto reductase [Geminisphaera colitermitum]|uniref:aldo/keto reductase n=1 Tax=Geminisphaera colitermitum TaxID=1148786 RepID=UPI000158C67F|nr:aldo/keto reductase [Geminisphaera colitermitum]
MNTPIPTKQLGKNGPRVSALGLGCMSIQKSKDENESVGTIQAALDAGINFLDTGDFYGMGWSETLVGRALKGRRDQAFISVKCGAMFSPTGAFLGIDGRPNSIKNFATYSLQRLGVDVIDLYQPCRIDPTVPYEDTIGAIADLIKEGKVRYLGVSEVGAENLRRAHKIHPVSALEIEYSLACRFIEREILPTARELGVSVIPYRVLADGLLTGTLSTNNPTGDTHMLPPRLEAENLQHNLVPVAALKEMAARKNCTSAQLAVAWLLARGDDIIPIVGMSRRSRLPENLKTLEVQLTAADLAELDRIFGPGAIKGDRYPAFVQKFAAQ